MGHIHQYTTHSITSVITDQIHPPPLWKSVVNRRRSALGVSPPPPICPLSKSAWNILYFAGLQLLPVLQKGEEEEEEEKKNFPEQFQAISVSELP